MCGVFMKKLFTLLLLSFLLSACQTSQPGLAGLNAQQTKQYNLDMQVAFAAGKSGNTEAAENALKDAIQQAPDAPTPVMMLAAVYVVSKEYQLATSLVEENLPKFKDQPQVASELNRQLGIAYWHLDQPNLAVSALADAYPNARQPDLVLNNLGIFLDHLGQHFMAQLCFKRGLLLAPKSDVLMNNYALSLIASGNIDTAKKLLNDPVLISSKNQDVLKNRDEAVKLLDEGQREQLSTQAIASAFRHQFGFNEQHAQITQENFQKISGVCQPV